MTWTYNAAALATTPLYQVRLLVGDTDTTDQLLQDEEILFELTLRPPTGAAAACAQALALKFGRMVDRQAGGSRIWSSQRSKAYRELAIQLEGKAAMMGAGLPYAGGISVLDKQAAEDDPDRVQPQFNVGMQDDFLPVGPVGNQTPDPLTGGG